MKTYDREYYLKNREKINARTMAYYYNHRDEKLAGFKEYYEKNKEAILRKKAERTKKSKPVFEIKHNMVVKFD